MSKRTAVEWLIDEIDMQYPQIDIRWKQWMINQAKEMEKQQIIKAFNEGTFYEMEKIDAEDYYNQTYGLPTEH